MFEITYNDADALERYEEEKRAYPGAKYDFTFEKRFLVYHADMLHQIIYYAIDMETGLSSEVMRRKTGSPVKKAEYASVLMDRLMDSIKYVGDRRTYLSEGMRTRSAMCLQSTRRRKRWMKSKHFSVRSKALPILRSDHARGTQSEKRKLPAHPRGSPLSAG